MDNTKPINEDEYNLIKEKVKPKINTNNPDDREKYLDKYYTKEGKETLKIRLDNLATLYTKNIKYPFRARILGFILLKIHSKQHHEGMIDELSQILGITEIIIKKGDDING